MTYRQVPRIISAIAVIFFIIFSVFGTGYCQNAETTDPAKVLEELKIPAIPENLNGVARNKLKGYDRLSELQKKLDAARGSIEGQLYLQSFVQKRLDGALKAGGQNEEAMPLNEIFTDGFEGATLQNLTDRMPQLPESIKAAALEALKSKTELIKLESFEKDISDDQKVSPKRARIFYDNARQKLKNSIGDELEQYKILHSQYVVDATALIRKNMAIGFRIGRNSAARTVQKNFRAGEDLWIGFSYGTQLISEPVPIQWKITFPDNQFRVGNTNLEADTQDGATELFSENLGPKPQNGNYTVEVTAFPSTDYKNTYQATFNVGNPPLKISSAFVLDANKKASGIFLAGQPILLVLQYIPPQGGGDSGNFSWIVSNPSDEKVANLSITKSLKLKTTEKEVQTKYIKGIIPKDAESGIYRYEGSITHSGETITSKTVEFLVRSGFTAQIIPNATKVKMGQKVILNSKVLGGKAPYHYKWDMDTGSTSTSQSIAMVFNRPGKKKITLTVTDSSKKPLKSTTYVHIQVNN